MNEFASILVSWQFVGIALVVGVIMTTLMKVGAALWRVKWKWLRQCLVFLDGVSPWLAPTFGAAVGAIPQIPRPSIIGDLPEGLGYASMILLGLFAGSVYEKIWKGIKQIMEARGLKLDADLNPKEQKKEWCK